MIASPPVTGAWRWIEDITFTNREDGSVVADRFPEYIAVSHELERTASRKVLRRARDQLAFIVANGKARYTLVEARPEHGFSLWRRLWGWAL